MKKVLALTLITVFLTIGFTQSIVRLKDIAAFRGARDNQLFGIGVVIGLNGSGDSNKVNSTLLANMISHFGVNIDPAELKTKNTALVMVLADIPPFYKEGMRLDVVVASIGDAKSLEGGLLVQTPLYGADGKVYAVAQGSISIGGQEVKGSSNLQKRYKVVGYIPSGAIVETEIPASIVDKDTVTILLNNPDITTAARAANAINVKFNSNIAKAVDPGSIKVTIPKAFKNDIITFLSILEGIEVAPDQPAKVIVNERTGTVIFGGEVKISDFSLSYGNFNITIKSGKIMGKEETEATTGNLVAALKALGATPQDIIAILQTLHEAGVLYAQLVVM
ncbi:MAG: flagellar basal body P-ring protein FlgI [Thermotogaceae bacterium]|nr:flagellar basal body P-ring protein FlgI [Thermotogaceae bacterium]